MLICIDQSQQSDINLVFEIPLYKMNSDLIYTIAKYTDNSRDTHINQCQSSVEHLRRKHKQIKIKLNCWLKNRIDIEKLYERNILKRVDTSDIKMKLEKMERRKMKLSFVVVKVDLKLLGTAKTIDFGLKRAILKRKLNKND